MSSAATPSRENQEDLGLGAGYIVAIILGVIAALALLVGLLVLWYRRRKQQTRERIRTTAESAKKFHATRRADWQSREAAQAASKRAATGDWDAHKTAAKGTMTTGRTPTAQTTTIKQRDPVMFHRIPPIKKPPVVFHVGP